MGRFELLKDSPDTTAPLATGVIIDRSGPTPRTVLPSEIVVMLNRLAEIDPGAVADQDAMDRFQLRGGDKTVDLTPYLAEIRRRVFSGEGVAVVCDGRTVASFAPVGPRVLRANRPVEADVGPG